MVTCSSTVYANSNRFLNNRIKHTNKWTPACCSKSLCANERYLYLKKKTRVKISFNRNDHPVHMVRHNNITLLAFSIWAITSAECSSLYSFKVKIVTSPMSIIHGRYMEIRRQYPRRINRKKTLRENDRIEKFRWQWCRKADVSSLFFFFSFQ